MAVRPAALVVTSFACALAGAAAALGVGRWSGWFDGEGKTVVVTAAPAAAPVPASATATGARASAFDAATIYRLRSPGVVTIFSYFGDRVAQGSGFVVSPQGYILTNSHVITDAGSDGSSRAHAADELYVEFADRDRVPAKVVGWDIFDDVGVVRVEPRAHSLSPLPLGDSSLVRVGEPVAAIGSPFGNENSLAVGVVAATHRSIASLTSTYDLVDAIQVDAPINHGNSGGPLLDGGGRVIGINAQIRSESGNAEGVGFSVPIDSARRSMTELIASGKVAYAYVGITSEDLTPSLARRLGYSAREGAMIDSVLNGGPAERAGLRGADHDADFNGTTVRVGGDVIVAIGGRPVSSSEDLVRIVAGRLRPGQTARFTVLRHGRKLELPVKLAIRPANPESR